MAVGDGQVSVETSDNLFKRFIVHNVTINYLRKQNNDILIKFVRIKLINSDIWIKTRSRFCICFQETGFGFHILFV